MLSPFEVSEDGNTGYLASSSLSGTRLNSKLEDISAAISVVTREQIDDLAARDINDIFMYETNTEGTHQYSAFTNDRGNISDDIANNPQGANRVRGLGAANVAIGSYSSTGTIPIDAYIVDAIEITRGPNSSIFGLGNTGGSINVITGRANLQKDSARLEISRTNGHGRRASVSANKTLIKGKLGLKVAALYDDKDFTRRPSQDETHRGFLNLTYKPFKSTTIRTSFESYRNANSRPNSYTPRDMYSDWAADGKPTWNPMTQIATYADGRTVSLVGVKDADLNKKLPHTLSYETGLASRPSWYIDNGEVQLYMVNRTSTTALPNNIGGKEFLVLNGTELTWDSANGTTRPLYVTPGTTDKAYYDWSSVNLSSPNWNKVKGETYLYELEQFIIDTPTHQLALQAGFFREDTATRNRTLVGKSDGAKLQVQVDVNQKLLDGTPNPFFLRPFIGGSEPAYSRASELNDNYRAVLAYQLNLTQQKGWLRHLGKHRFAGYSEYRFLKTGSFIYRDRIVSTESWVPANSKTGNTGGSANIYPRYYVGDANGQNVDYAPTRLQRSGGEYIYRYYDGVAKQWITESVDFGESFGGGQYTKKLNSTVGGVYQGFFFKDRVIPVLGWREDSNRSRRGDAAGPATLETGGFNDTTKLDNFTTQEWIKRKGRTKTAGLIVKPFNWINLRYNQSDSFKPTSLAYDVWGSPLSDPSGNSKDYGFELKLFKDKLRITATQYETYDINARSTLGTIVQRAIRLDADGTGGDPDLQDFLITELTQLHPDWTPEALTTEANKLMKVDAALIDSHRNSAHSDVNDAISKGKEIEIYYTPNKFLTFKANVTQQKAMDTKMSPELQNYIDSRWDTWTTIKGPATGNLWWKTTQGSTTPEGWFYSNVNKDLKLATATAGKWKAQTREWRANLISKVKLAGITSHRILRNFDLTSALRWEGKVGVGYMAGAPDVDGIVRELDANKPIYDKARTYLNFGIGYEFKNTSNTVKTRIQLNVNNVFEDGSLRAVAFNPDGTPYQFRIIDPRQISLMVRFDL